MNASIESIRAAAVLCNSLLKAQTAVTSKELSVLKAQLKGPEAQAKAALALQTARETLSNAQIAADAACAPVFAAEFSVQPGAVIAKVDANGVESEALVLSGMSVHLVGELEVRYFAQGDSLSKTLSNGLPQQVLLQVGKGERFIRVD